MRSGIHLAGTVILDIVHVVDLWPAEEQLALIDHSEYGAGGPPHNAAAALIKLGAGFPVTCRGVVGDDAYGAIFLKQAEAYGLARAGFLIESHAITSHTHVMTVKASGRRTFFHHAGVNARLTPDMLAAPPDGRARIFYLGAPGIAAGMDAQNGWAEALASARAAGHITALELVSVPPPDLRRLVTPLLPLTDIAVFNDSEAQALTGITLSVNGRFDREAALAACRKLLDLGVGQVAAVHHPAGAAARRRTGESAAAGSVKVPPQEIVGTVGAGDAFYGGMLLGLHENWPLADCLTLANAAAATSLASATTSASIRPWRDCLAYAGACGLNPF